MEVLRVGELYIASRTRWPEGAEYNFSAAGHELRLFFSDPTAAEVRAVRQAPIHIGMIFAPPVIDLVWKIDGIGDWSDCPYSWNLLPASHRVLPEETNDQQRALLNVLLINASNGILEAIRAVSLPPHATARLHGAIREQAGLAWNFPEYMAAKDRLYATYSDSSLMAAAAELLVKAGT